MNSPWFRSGIFVPPLHPNEEDPTLAMHRDMELVEWADKLGFEEAWIGEHHSGGFEIIGSPEIFIAAVARTTKRIRLGTGVTSLPYHNPFMVAERIVQLDHMTMGRVMLGAGAGALVSDANMLGIDPNGARDRMVEALEIVLRLMRGETVTYKSDWLTLNNAYLHVRPFTKPHPEIVVASAKTPTSARLAGRLGIGMLCVAASSTEGFDSLGSNWQIANDIAAEHGNTMDRNNLRLVAPIHLAETREEALANVKYGLEQYLDYSWSITPNTRKRAAGMDPVEFVTKIRGGVIGTPDDAIALIERLQAQQGEFGCFLHQSHNWADWEKTKKSYELYARYVVPHFRKANVDRERSLQHIKEIEADIGKAQASAIATAFANHNADRAAHGKGKVEITERKLQPGVF